jgi:hypothetical protein
MVGVLVVLMTKVIVDPKSQSSVEIDLDLCIFFGKEPVLAALTRGSMAARPGLVRCVLSPSVQLTCSVKA